MSTFTEVENTGSQAHFQTNTNKIFIGENRYENDSYVNNSLYDPITLEAGTVMGRIAATRILVPIQPSASDGSQYPVGILAQDLTVDSGDTVQAALCVYGDVAEDQIKFYNDQYDLNTVVSSRTLRDRIKGDTAGIRIIPSTDLTGFDNE